MNPNDTKSTKALFPRYRVSTVLSKFITIGDVYETQDFDDACSMAVVYETKFCRRSDDYDVKVKIELFE